MRMLSTLKPRYWRADTKAMHGSRDPTTPSRHVPADGGFTMIEVLVTAVLFVIGMLATFALLDGGAQATASSTQRDGANAVADELVERATGMRYDGVYNDLTDRRTSAPAGVLTGTPAERFRTAMAPDATTAAPIAETDAAHPWRSTATWNVTRGNTVYKVSYQACTDSDSIDGVQIAGPFDCGRGAEDPLDPGSNGGDCRIGLIPPSEIRSGTNPLDVRLQLLGGIGLQVCVGALPLGLGNLSTSLCQLLNNSGSGSLANLLTGLTGTTGLLSALQGALHLDLLGANVSLCPSAVDSDLSGPKSAIGTSTRIEIRVAWTDREGNRARNIRQTTVIRRAGA